MKEVDANEVTVRFYQEIYNELEKLVEVHHKYPIDQGHQKIEEPKSTRTRSIKKMFV